MEVPLACATPLYRALIYSSSSFGLTSCSTGAFALILGIYIPKWGSSNTVSVSLDMFFVISLSSLTISTGISVLGGKSM